MCAPQPSNEFPLIFRKDGKTCVFWDVEDYPIPAGLHPRSIRRRIVKDVKKYGCDAEVSIHAYANDNTVSVTMRRQFSAAGIKLEVFTQAGDKYARHCSLYGDIMLWSLENPPPSNIIVIAKIIDDDLADRIGCLTTVWSYGLLISQVKPEWLERLFPVGSYPSFLAAIFDGGLPKSSKANKDRFPLDESDD
ncbi:NYN domain limkain-b1-type [Arabidopsis thaliana x Arabidopsis arenosa]|uniref:NYN domain limkain-b1-type n=3 Tax=Arabidopsis TaxID=3701 RepID=A0A8T2EDX2_ARASU|nr:NYN domain limkain-b1-type [Arabidopsis thaliana x Arabidopsis arenosa]KAG7622395.1 NYN domain limkain-b1-type [Arabidopsis suecica]OAO97665.1 hypothetical protein AXX17_AT4G35250 [Arabidopsis thaliana]CAD5329566.1 unnamed protein product [Arabidopsis thaliana]